MELTKNILDNIVNKLAKKYEFLGFDNDYYYEMIENSLNQYNAGFEEDNSSSISSQIEKRLNSDLIKIVCDKLNDPNESYRIVENYIKMNISYSSNYEKIMKELRKLEQFFTKYNYIPSSKTCIKLLENNEVLSQLLSSVVSKNINEIQNGNMNEIFNDILSVTFFIESFCKKNNIEIKDDSYLSNEDNGTKKQLLTTEETNELLFKWQQEGNVEARNKIVECNVGLISLIVKRYLDRGADREDLFQEGILGMMRALDTFDYSTGYKLSTYATWWIAQAIKHFVEDKSKNMKVPVHVQNKLYHYNKISNDLKQKLGRDPKISEIAEEMNITVKQLEKILMKSREVLSLNYYVGETDDAEFGDFLVDDTLQFEDKIIDEDFVERIQILFKKCKLTPQEIDIIERRLGLKTGNIEVLEEIAKSYGLTRERIRQIEKKALFKLKRSAHTAEFFGYEVIPEGVITVPNRNVKNNNLNNNNSSTRNECEVISKQRKNGAIPLIEIFNKGDKKYSELEIKRAVLQLNEEEKKLLLLRYTPGYRFDSIDSVKLYSNIFPKIRENLEKGRCEDGICDFTATSEKLPINPVKKLGANI